MSAELRQRVEQLFEATKDLRSFEELAPHCEQFNKWIEESKLSLSTLGSRLSSAGFYKMFRTLPLEQDKNAVLTPKFDENLNQIGSDLKHYVLVNCGLTKEQWTERNTTARVTNRLESGQEVDPDSYIEVTAKLLDSNDPHQLAVGLIAATGRRPHEIIARAKFTPVPDEPYKVNFSGQGKKLGKEVEFTIATLFPASQVIKALNKLRNEPSTKALRSEIAKQFPRDVVAQNDSIENRRGTSLRRVVREFFGGDGIKQPVLNYRSDKEQNDCKALRAACAALVTERECVGSIGMKMLYFGRFLGHIELPEKANDRELHNAVTSLGYADYYVTKAVPYPPEPGIPNAIRIGVTHEVRDTLNDLKEVFGVTTQGDVIEKLIASHLNRVEGVKQMNQEIETLKTENQQLKEQPVMNIETNQELVDLVTSLVARIEVLEAERNTSTSTPSEKLTNVGTTPKAAQPKEEIDWTAVSNAQLWSNADGTSNRAKGTTEEKIRRSFEAIAKYNDTIATGDGDRIAITNLALRALSGVNGLVVGDWIKTHADEIITHHAKYEMTNSKDASKVTKSTNS